MKRVVIETASGQAELDCADGHTLFDALAEADFLPRADCGGRGVCGLCRIRVREGDCTAVTAQERSRLTPDEIGSGMRLACMASARSALRLTIPQPGSRRPWSAISSLPPLPAATRPGHGLGHGLGIAVDAGSTNLRLSLVDLAANRRIAALRGLNPQGRYGSDVLARLAAATQPRHATRMATETLRAIGEGIAQLFTGEECGGMRRDAVTRVRLVGNTAVLMLLSHADSRQLLEPDNWSRQIPIPLTGAADWHDAWGLGNAAEITLGNSLFGFVGSDLLAAVVASGLTRTPAPALLVDFGTNTEIALWDGRRLWVTAAAGGPAFEGSGISCGYPAETGAVYRVQDSVDNAGAPLTLLVIGDVPPLGLCGSALVDVIAVLRQRDWLAPSGRLRPPAPQGGVPLAGDNPALVLRNQDIGLFQRAKAAVAAGIQILMHKSGIAAPGLERVWISGIFGRHLEPANAMAVGLLPQVTAGCFALVQDAALLGCEQWLSEDGNTRLAETAALAIPVNLAVEPDYEELFVELLRLQPF